VLATAGHREGQEAGTDLPLFAAVLAAATAPVFASGGIHSRDELQALAAMGCAGAVLGMSLYTGRLDAAALAQEFAS
jgi:phosphoribosylformimino-5-aminoimidazole carboxamide ribotide isomerase